MTHPISLLSTLVLVFLSSLFLITASPSPAPDPYPAVVSLPARQPPIAGISTQPALPRVEHDLLPFVLISTIDGSLHAVDRDTGKVRWILKDGVEPLVGGGVKGTGNGEEYIVEPLSGNLFVFETEQEGTPKIRRLPLCVEQLIELSPFTFPQSPSRIFTGSKQTSLLTIDLRSGQQLDCFAPGANISLADDDDCFCNNDQLLDDLEGRSRTNGDTLLVGRSDFRLTIHTPPQSSNEMVLSTPALSGVSRRGAAGTQDISYSTYTPNSYDKPLADYWAKASGSVMEQDGSESKRVRVELRHDGAAVGVEQGGGAKWSKELGSIGIAVYDILLPMSPPSAHPILVPQPPPHLPSLFPPPPDPRKSHLDMLSKPPTTYVGTVPSPLVPALDASRSGPSLATNNSPARQRGSAKPLLYALSSTSYPLINFAPPPRPGSLANGSFLVADDQRDRDSLLPYMIDPAPEDEIMAQPSERAVSSTDDSQSSQRRFLSFWGILGLLSFIAFLLSLSVILIKGPAAQSATNPPIVNEKVPLVPVLGTVLDENTSLSVPPQAGVESATLSEDQTTPTRKKIGRKRVRGKKKRGDAAATDIVDDEDEDEHGAQSQTPPSGDPGRAEKPLPELPRELSSTDLLNTHDKEKLSISDCVIGYGSHGTVVLKGTWGGRPVAVKRLLSDFTRLASQEVKLLQASDDHPNVIRYYCQERRDNFLYIALDLCQASLADLIESPSKHAELASVLDRKKALQQVTAGLKHLHGMKIIHRDIKPQNVLVSQGKDGALRLLVSDFGLARRLEQGQSSFAPTANNLAGSLGWRAPECIRGQVRLNDDFENSSSSSASSSSSLLDLAVECEATGAKGKGHARLTKAVDLFALGCLYFWVLMSGEHPFGEIYDRESNIVKGDVVNISQLDILGEEGWEAKDLVGRLLGMEPSSRPDTSECLIHPLFWTPGKRVAFLCDASDRFEIMELEPPEPTLVKLEANAAPVVGKDWYSRMDKVIISNLGKYRKYRGNSVRDLLRAMRNKKHHYQDLEPAVKRHLGAMPAGFLHYFTSRYPTLFLHVHRVVRDGRLRHESMFEAYFDEGG